MARMVRKQVYIDERQDALLKERAELTGRTESELIRRAIDEAYDPMAAQRDFEERWAEYESGMRRLGDLIAEAGGLPRWNRDQRNARRPPE
ncbi:MAG: hypothetical protein C0418_04885 [Coriobacteriaceae bacterium]|nr:hypothetical protein [Coriobacteriaceae bacterium]